PSSAVSPQGRHSRDHADELELIEIGEGTAELPEPQEVKGHPYEDPVDQHTPGIRIPWSEPLIDEAKQGPDHDQPQQHAEQPAEQVEGTDDSGSEPHFLRPPHGPLEED